MYYRDKSWEIMICLPLFLEIGEHYSLVKITK